jgi:hypothetical protein
MEQDQEARDRKQVNPREEKARADVAWVVALQKARAVIASPQIAVKRQPISKAAHVMNRNAPSVVLPWPANRGCFYSQKKYLLKMHESLIW